jgi:aspartyl-tRNA(Asn)/glutamyl-tRNA(Gln) amidotransferase subunit A
MDDLTQVSQLVRTKKVSPVELTQECLRRIDRLNPQLNAFITISAESALAEARTAEAEIQSGDYRGPLHGIPIALKDLIDTAGVRTTAASALFANRIPAQDAEVVRSLKAAGAVFLGKTNLHEFAYGGTSAISHFGAVRNPWNTTYTPGGSSGGSAAAVAAQLCYAAIGTDTGGSVRQPAAYCGIVGLKPTFGRVSAAGVVPLSQSLDHVGPMARTVRDTALMFEAIAPSKATEFESSTSSLRLGIPRDYFYERLEADIQAAMEIALGVLQGMGHSLPEVPPLATDASYSSMMLPYTTLLRAEAYAYHQDSVAKNPELYQPATLKRILAGAEVTPESFQESRRAIEAMRQDVLKHFETVDLLITPTAPISPLLIADLADPDTARPKELEMLRNTRPFNALGLPTISVLCGFTAQGLPIGLQITGKPGAEADVLRLANAYEQATQWYRRSPGLAAS